MKVLIRILAVALIIIVCSLFPKLGFAEENGPREASVGLYLLNMGKLDTMSGTFDVDFYITIKDSQPIKDDSFELMNGRILRFDLNDEYVEDDGTYVKIYRIIAALTTKIDLKNFPFDKQKLGIMIESTIENTEDLIYVPIENETGMDEYNRFPGWKILGWDTEVNNHHYDVFDESYSQYVFNVSISKMWFNSFMKTFLPVLFTVLITLVIFIIAPDKVTTRLEIICSLLIAIAMFHISIFSQLPPVSYLTVADKFMFLTYFFLLICICVNVYIYKLNSNKENKNVIAIDKKIRYALFGLVPLTYLLFFVFFIE
ncbi:ligand-gated ion channel [Sutcliffiella halmapala]|uniref:hypothetical protein n=1 Tax=Sutcliffiella halmapala TaxID=79882 RepID=UPI0009953A5D|nr:hypothetical protein [Sutcliffiella halmapala]